MAGVLIWLGAARALTPTTLIATNEFDVEAALGTLDELERESAGLKIPFGPLRGPYFEMRQNLHDVRARVEERR